MKISIIQRYILQSVVGLFGLLLVILTSMMLLSRLFKLTDLMLDQGVPLRTVATLLLYLLPSFLVLTIPMALFFATTLTFARLASDNELLILVASGVNLYRLYLPIAGLSFLIYLISIGLNLQVAPWANLRFKQLVFYEIQARTHTAFKEGVFDDTFKGLVIYVHERLRSDNTLRGIFIEDSRNAPVPQTIMAEWGSFSADPQAQRLTLQLRNGSIHRLGPNPARYQLINFASYQLTLNLRDPLLEASKTAKGKREFSFAELRQRIRELRAQGQSDAQEAVVLHMKFSLPFAGIILGFVALPLGAMCRGTGRLGSMAVSLLLLLGYYVLLIGGEGLGDEGRLPAALAMWTPNLLLGLLGLYCFRQVNNSPSWNPLAALLFAKHRAGEEEDEAH